MTSRRLRQDAIWREADGEVIAIDERLTNYVSTNGAGALLWKQLADGATPDELADRLVGTYGIERERAERDVRAFLADLDAQGFLEG
jgi:DNA-binding GntR family transcriptional regulator